MMKTLYKFLYAALVTVVAVLLVEIVIPGTILGRISWVADHRGFAMLWIVAGMAIICTLLIATESWGFYKKRVAKDPTVTEAVLFVFSSILTFAVTADLVAYSLRLGPTWFEFLKAKLSNRLSDALGVFLAEITVASLILGLSMWHYRRRIKRLAPTL